MLETSFLTLIVFPNVNVVPPLSTKIPLMPSHNLVLALQST